MSYDKIKIDQNVPLPPRNTGKKLNQELLDIVSKIPVHGSIAFDDMKEMERITFAKSLAKDQPPLELCLTMAEFSIGFGE